MWMTNPAEMDSRSSSGDQESRSTLGRDNKGIFSCDVPSVVLFGGATITTCKVPRQWQARLLALNKFSI